MRIAHAQSPLFGAIDEEQAAERPERLTAEILRTLLIHDDDAFAGVGHLGRSDESRESGSDDDGVRTCVHATAFASASKGHAFSTRARTRNTIAPSASAPTPKRIGAVPAMTKM